MSKVLLYICLLLFVVSTLATIESVTVQIDTNSNIITYQGQTYTLTNIYYVEAEAGDKDEDGGGEENYVQLWSKEFFIYSGVSFGLVCFAGIMSGLSVGLFSIDPLKLELLKLNGDDELKKQAEELEPILSKHHYLLVTLLLSNALCMEALPIFLNKLVSEVIAIILSVSFVLIFGEIIPQALCVQNPLSIGAKFAWLVKALMFILFPLAYPIGKLLDRILGHAESRHILFKRSELKNLVDLHINPAALSHDEALMLKGALELKQKTAEEACTKITDERIMMLSENDVLDYNTMCDIMASGFSRIPVYRGDSLHNVIGMVLVKRLIVVDPEENRPLNQIGLRFPIVVDSNTSLYHLLNLFQEGRSHLALVTDYVDEYRRALREEAVLPEYACLKGIITIEDVLEDLIQEEIEDELDLGVSQKPDMKPEVRKTLSRFKNIIRKSRDEGKAKEDSVRVPLLEHDEKEDYE